MQEANVLLLNVIDNEVREITVSHLEDFYKHLKCSCFDIARRKIAHKEFDIYCDNEGLLKEGAIVSAINANGGAMLVGNLIFAQHDGRGNTIGLTKKEKEHILRNIGYAMPMEGKPYLILLNCEY